MEDHHSEKSVEEEKNNYQRVCGHLKAFIEFSQVKLTEKDLKSEAASYLAQLKIMKLLTPDKKNCHSFEINEEFGLTCKGIQDKITDSAELTSSQLTKIKKYCCSQELKKTTYYSCLNADPEVKKLWKKRSKLLKAEIQEILEKEDQSLENSLKRKLEESEIKRFQLQVEFDLFKKKVALEYKPEKQQNHSKPNPIVSSYEYDNSHNNIFNSLKNSSQPDLSEGYDGGLFSSPDLANS
jgi:cell division protein ZapA (FtsZ GTPase activity inhibitor)